MEIFLVIFLFLFSFLILFLGLFSRRFFVERNETGKQGKPGDDGECINDLENNQTYEIISLEECYTNQLNIYYYYISPTNNNNNIFNITLFDISSFQNIMYVNFLLGELLDNTTYEIFLTSLIDQNSNFKIVYYNFASLCINSVSTCENSNNTFNGCQNSSAPFVTFINGTLTKSIDPISPTSNVYFKLNVLNQNKVNIEYKSSK